MIDRMKTTPLDSVAIEQCLLSVGGFKRADIWPEGQKRVACR